MYRSSQKVDVPDPTPVILRELQKSVVEIHSRLEGIEDTLGQILLKLDALHKALSEEIEKGFSRNAAIELNATCGAFAQAASNSQTSKAQLQTFLFQVAAKRLSLSQRDDVHCLSLFTAAHTEIAGHRLAGSNKKDIADVASAYLERFKLMRDATNPKSLESLWQQAKMDREYYWNSIVVNSFGTTSAKRELAWEQKAFEFDANTIDDIKALVDKKTFSVAHLYQVNCAQNWFDYRKFHPCMYFMFSPTNTTKNEPQWMSRTPGKISTVFRSPNDCEFIIRVERAVHDVLFRCELDVREFDFKFDEIALQNLHRVPYVAGDVVQAVRYNGSKAYLRKLANPKIEDYDLLYSRSARNFPLHPGQVSRPIPTKSVKLEGVRHAVPHVAEAIVETDGENECKNNRDQMKKFLSSKQNQFKRFVANLNDAQDAYTSLTYAKLLLDRTEKFVGKHV